MYKIFLPAYNSGKIIKIHQDFPELLSQMYCHLFMVHSVDFVRMNEWISNLAVCIPPDFCCRVQVCNEADDFPLADHKADYYYFALICYN